MTVGNAKKLIRDGLFNPTHRHMKNGQYATILFISKDISKDQRRKEKILFITASGNTWILNREEFDEVYREYIP